MYVLVSVCMRLQNPADLTTHIHIYPDMHLEGMCVLCIRTSKHTYPDMRARMRIQAYTHTHFHTNPTKPYGYTSTRFPRERMRTNLLAYIPTLRPPGFKGRIDMTHEENAATNCNLQRCMLCRFVLLGVVWCCGSVVGVCCVALFVVCCVLLCSIVVRCLAMC